MRLLLAVHQFYPAYTHGTETYAAAIALAAKRTGHEVLIVTGDPERRYRARSYVWNDVPVVVVDSRELLDYAADDRHGEYDHLLADQRPDLLHVCNLQGLGGALLEAAHSRRIPIVMTLTDYWLVCPNVRLWRFQSTTCHGEPDPGVCLTCVSCDSRLPLLRRWKRAPSISGRLLAKVYNHARLLLKHGRRDAARIMRAFYQRRDRASAWSQLPAVLIAPSRAMAETARRLLPTSSEIIHIPYGVEIQPALFVPRSPQQPLRLLYVGSLAPHKGVHVLVRACRDLADLPWRLTICGARDETQARHWRKSLGEDERITVRTTVPRDELPLIFASHDMLIVPSIWRENTPFVALEGLACGITVLVAAVDGMLELESFGAATFPPDNPPALATAIRRSAERGRPSASRSIPTAAEQWEATAAVYASCVAQSKNSAIRGRAETPQ